MQTTMITGKRCGDALQSSIRSSIWRRMHGACCNKRFDKDASIWQRIPGCLIGFSNLTCLYELDDLTSQCGDSLGEGCAITLLFQTVKRFQQDRVVRQEFDCAP